MNTQIRVSDLILMLSGDLLVDPALIVEGFHDNPMEKVYLAKCHRGEITYKELLEQVGGMF